MASSRNNRIDLRSQLWLECAGLTIKVPCVGDKVFYFPQGHLQQVEAYTKQEGMCDIPSYGLPSKILCKVVCVQLEAEVDTDEVFAKITLLPDFEEGEGSRFRNAVPEKIPSIFFRKRLTPSDVMKQGGCSLHKRHVEQTYPPLDFSQDTPSQDLYAKDLHGEIWKFHHICRGVPRRHLLTTGWGKFVSEKKLLAGDICIFLRGKHEMYVGVQRAVRPNKMSTNLSTINMQHGILLTALEAIKTRTEFAVYYHPRISPSGFIVAYDDYMESLKVDFSPRTKVELIIDVGGGEEPEQNLKMFWGMIIRKEDVDPTKWPRSEWQSLRVCWDATASRYALPKRVSPWAIKSLGFVVPHQQSLVSLGQKRSMPFNPMIGIIEGTVLTLGPPKVNSPISSCETESKKCTLFGVDIGECSNTDTHSPESSNQQYQNYIKVLKHGAPFGRFIDISLFSGYKWLMSELDMMFEFEGTLLSGKSGWYVTYADENGNKKLLGYLSWSDFRGVVRKMYICQMEEVPRWNRSG